MVSGSVCTKFQVSAVFFILSGVRPELVHSTQQFLEKPFRLRHVDLKTINVRTTWIWWNQFKQCVSLKLNNDIYLFVVW